MYLKCRQLLSSGLSSLDFTPINERLMQILEEAKNFPSFIPLLRSCLESEWRIYSSIVMSSLRSLFPNTCPDIVKNGEFFRKFHPEIIISQYFFPKRYFTPNCNSKVSMT